MLGTFRFLHTYFWKTLYGPILSFLFPIALVVILGHIMRIEYIYPGIIGLSMLFIGTLSLPLAMMELKGSTLFKFLGTTSVNSKRFSLVVVGFYVLVSLVSYLLITITTMIAFKEKVFVSSGLQYGILAGISTLTNNLNYWFSFFLHLALTISIGIIIATFAKTTQKALTISVILMIPSMFLSGMILSVDIIAQSKAMNWISRFMPFRYTVGNLMVSSTPLEQTKDIMQQLSIEEKNIIFNTQYNGSDNLKGNLRWKPEVANILQYYKNDAWHDMNNMNALKDWDSIFLKNHASGGDPLQWSYLSSHTLYRLIFIDNNFESLKASTNRIFDFKSSWSTYRIPDPEAIKKFVMEYFLGLRKFEDGKYTIPFTELNKISDNIIKRKFDWINIFMKQSNVLYTGIDKALDIFLPMTIIGINSFLTYKFFTWSNR